MFDRELRKNGSVSGTPYGSLAAATVGYSITVGSAFNPAIANTVVVKATHSLAGPTVLIEPKLRILTVG